MPWFDLPLDELRHYAPEINEPDDFDAFWQATLNEFAAEQPDVSFQPVNEACYAHVDVFDVTFAGYGGDTIRGWFLTPAGNAEQLPCIVSYVGYGGGRGEPIDHFVTPVAGFAHFVMDTRGQGASWSAGATADPAGTGSHQPGFMTKGIEARETYYYRRLYVDAVCAVRAAVQHPRVDTHRIAVNGASQGGGLAIAAAALSGDVVKACCADVPFLCHFQRAITLTEKLPYAEIARYLKVHRDRVAQVRKTLSYFDGVSMAAWIKAPSLFSAGLMDMTCPPSTIFAAYNRVTSEKEIAVYDFNEHEGGGSEHTLRRLKFLRRQLMGERTS